MEFEELKRAVTEKLLKYYRQGKWKDVVNMFEESNVTNNEHFYDQRYLWIRPSEDNLQFIKEAAVNTGCLQIISIGCGSGLLEWLIQQATGLDVIGVEVNREWWESRYAVRNFIPLLYADESQENNVIANKKSALLFCYFNNGSAFSKYMQQFGGNCLIIIGPGEGRWTHTDPTPFDIKLENWKLQAFQEVQTTKDFIAIYTKS
ncbi:hypothetical protein L9F63_010188 [Diploptera punctata]|uniref:Uncharacterized protein n=1 Tax=Diploptera punctata TaxID=6984 RepID=A0AAD8ER54_DIPPU|nr:hypothetical protein L9F63_010188 [Diploptera punctata]